jgi:hypothetical protein
MTATFATQVTRQGLTGQAAKAAVERKLLPHYAELEQLQKERADIELWQSEAQEADQRARDLHALAQSARGHLQTLTKEQQAKWLALLDIKVKVLENPPAMRRGLACPVGEWFREHKREVPTLDDQVWERIAELEGFPNGGLVLARREGWPPGLCLRSSSRRLARGHHGPPWRLRPAPRG